MKCYFEVKCSFLTKNDYYHTVSEKYEDVDMAMRDYNDAVERYETLKKDCKWKCAKVELKIVNEVQQALI